MPVISCFYNRKNTGLASCVKRRRYNIPPYVTLQSCCCCRLPFDSDSQPSIRREQTTPHLSLDTVVLKCRIWRFFCFVLVNSCLTWKTGLRNTLNPEKLQDCRLWCHDVGRWWSMTSQRRTSWSGIANNGGKCQCKVGKMWWIPPHWPFYSRSLWLHLFRIGIQEDEANWNPNI